MEKLRFTEAQSMRSILQGVREQWYEINAGFLNHLTLWKKITNDFGQSFEVIDEPIPYGKGTIFGKEYVVKLGSSIPNVKSPEILGIIRVVANHAVSGEPLEIESYRMNQGRNFFSKSSMTPIVMESFARAEYQIICESIYAVAESSDV